jgi:ubiquitin carboxyl-terminal hydrolase 22/27/51
MEPYVPNEFLWAMWVACSQLVGYAQQDAHEFFIGVLNGIHSNLETSELSRVKTSSNSDDPHACSCIIHRIFSGTFQSTVKCLQCGYQSRAYDPFLDISLDIRPLASPILFPGKIPSDKQLNGTNGTNLMTPHPTGTTFASTTPNPIAQPPVQLNGTHPATPIVTTGLDPIHHLYECLDLFTHQERLSPAEYKCSQCAHLTTSAASAGALKQLSFKKLPMVLCLQIKRFDHRHLLMMQYNTNNSTNSSNGSDGKLDAMVRFPLELDMTAYTSQTIGQGKRPPPHPEYLYTLFAVIVHHGTLHSGHYTCYVRQSGCAGQWFRFDDDRVTMAEWNEVADCQA